MANPFTTMIQNGPSQGHPTTALIRAPQQRHLSEPHLTALPSATTNGSCQSPSGPRLTDPALTTISINIEGFSQNKAEILSELCRTTQCDILCIQETHRDYNMPRPHIPGLTLVAEIPHAKHGSAIFTRPNISILSISCNSIDTIETLTVDTGHCTVTSIYKPPNQPFKFNETDNFRNRATKIIIGDFNSHSSSWGYRETNADGTAVEEWAENQDLVLIHDPKLPASFNSGRWKRGYNPDLLFVSKNISSLCKKIVSGAIPNTQHRPISCQVHSALRPTETPFRRRFNFSKADWEQYAHKIDVKLNDLEPSYQNYDQFVDIIKTVSRQTIPRGCRSQYIPGLNVDSAKLLEKYEHLYAKDPFADDTIEAGEALMLKLSKNRQEKWIKTVTEIDMVHNSKKAWKTLKKLTDDTQTPLNPGPVSANKVAQQLLLNGKAPHKLPKSTKPVKHTDGSNDISKPFTLTDIILAIKVMKSGKAAGVDDLTVEQIKHLGPVAVSWLLALFNVCAQNTKLPKAWRKAKVTALLKPGKTPDDPKNYRPISLLCHTYKLFERLLLNRLIPIIDPKLIPEQAGFRPGKSCTGQILKLTQHIENGFQKKLITGTVLVDLSAAYDTVNIKRLLSKLSSMVNDQGFIDILGEMLRNRRFQVFLNGKKSRWRTQKNGLPQGSVLAPILFNIYTNDQPHCPHTDKFLYADDLALTTQSNSFEEIESTLSHALDDLSTYYDNNALRPNPSKTQSCVFHLKNHLANQTLNINWRGTKIQHSDHPTYLGVTLDRSLTYKYHCNKTKQKVSTRNNLLSRLISTTWGASPHVLRTTGLALCFSAGEYGCPVWNRSAHAKQVDAALNETCRIISGCLKPTPLNMLYPLAGIAPPSTRRNIACSIEKQKQESDQRHSLYGENPPKIRLKSRSCFLTKTTALTQHPKEARQKLWKDTLAPPPDFIAPTEELPAGCNLPWSTWKSLNRLRTQVGRCRENMVKWGYTERAQCNCGATTQTMQHLLSCPQCPQSCTPQDLYSASPCGVAVAKYWEATV